MAITPLSQAVLQGMDPNVYRPLGDISQGQDLVRQGMDGSPTTGWGAVGRLASALAGSYISNSATSDLAKTIAAGKASALKRDMATLLGPDASETAAVPQAPPALTSQPPAPIRTASVGDVALPSTAPRAPVQSSPKVWGDDEAVAAGLYEPKPGGPPAPAQLAQAPNNVQPSVPQQPAPDLRQRAAGYFATINDPYSSDGAKAVAQAGLKALGPQPDQFASIGDGWVMNSKTGKAERKYTPDDKTPTSVREYEYYKKNLPADQAPMDYAPWTIEKARAAAGNVNVDTKAETEYNKALGKAKGEAQAEDIKAGSHASNKLRQLATLDEANKSGGDDISSGPLGKVILSGKQGLSELTGVDLKGVPESEVIQKVGFGLATNMVKAITQRPSQMEFGKALENVPGLYMSKQGRVAMTSILAQDARAEQELGRLANKHHEKPDGPGWQEVKDKYYEDHPLMSPFTGKPFGEADIQMLTKAAPSQAPGGPRSSPSAVSVSTPDEARKLPSGTQIILPDGTPGVVP